MGNPSRAEEAMMKGAILAAIALVTIGLVSAQTPAVPTPPSGADAVKAVTALSAYMGGLVTYGMAFASLLFIYSWIYGSVGAKFYFWSYVGLIIVVMIYLPNYWSTQSLQATIYSLVMGTICYRGFYATFCLQSPSRFEGDKSNLGSRVDY